MIFIYGTRVKKDNISRCFLHFFQVLIFRVNSVPKWQKTLSIAPYILRTIHHMIFIYGTYVKMLIISWCFLQFLQVLIFGVNRGVKEQKMSQNDKIIYHTPYLRKHTSYDCHCYTCVKRWHLQMLLSFSQNFDFSGC